MSLDPHCKHNPLLEKSSTPEHAVVDPKQFQWLLDVRVLFHRLLSGSQMWARDQRMTGDQRDREFRADHLQREADLGSLSLFRRLRQKKS